MHIFSGKNVLPPTVDWAPTPMPVFTKYQNTRNCNSVHMIVGGVIYAAHNTVNSEINVKTISTLRQPMPAGQEMWQNLTTRPEWRFRATQLTSVRSKVMLVAARLLLFASAGRRCDGDCLDVIARSVDIAASSVLDLLLWNDPVNLCQNITTQLCTAISSYSANNKCTVRL